MIIKAIKNLWKRISGTYCAFMWCSIVPIVELWVLSTVAMLGVMIHQVFYNPSHLVLAPYVWIKNINLSLTIVLGLFGLALLLDRFKRFYAKREK